MHPKKLQDRLWWLSSVIFIVKGWIRNKVFRKNRKIKEVQVQMSEREFGESYLDLVNTIKYMSRMMVSIFLIQPFRKVK